MQCFAPSRDFWSALATRIGTTTGGPSALVSLRPLSGGDINQAWHIQLASHHFFVKLSHTSRGDTFAAEAIALKELGVSVRAPQPICHGKLMGQAYLVLEYLALTPLTSAAGAILGHQLAELHRQPQPYFGWQRDNAIGATTQSNDPSDDWAAFWSEQRLRPQLRLAASNGYTGRLQRDGDRLLAGVGDLLGEHQPVPALLHGDLWSGNAAAIATTNEPVIFDPASYYGDREADIAMTELFGVFPASFYTAYRDVWPLDAGYTLRRDLYNLYHLLNHLNLFGGRYQAASERLLRRLLDALRD